MVGIGLPSDPLGHPPDLSELLVHRWLEKLRQFNRFKINPFSVLTGASRNGADMQVWDVFVAAGRLAVREAKQLPIQLDVVTTDRFGVEGSRT